MAIPEPDETPAEFSFLYRRLIAIVWLVVNSGFVAWIIWISSTLGAADPTTAIRSLMWLGLALTASNLFMALLYYAGASAVDIGKLVQGLAQIKFGGSRPSDPEPTPSRPDGE